MVVFGVQPLARFVVVAADERVEAAVDAKKEQRELALLALRDRGRDRAAAATPTLRSTR